MCERDGSPFKQVLHNNLALPLYIAVGCDQCKHQNLVTAYCYKNVTFRKNRFLTKRCSAAAEVWPGDGTQGWPGPLFFESEVHISEMKI